MGFSFNKTVPRREQGETCQLPISYPAELFEMSLLHSFAVSDQAQVSCRGSAFQMPQAMHLQ